MTKGTLAAVDIKVQKVPQSRLSQVDFNHLPFGKIFSDHMFVADYANGQWGECRVVPYDYLRISPANSTLHYGQTVFEGMKAQKSAIEDKILVFRPYENFIRMNTSAERLCMPTIPEEVFFGGLQTLLDVDRQWVPTTPDSSLYIRPIFFATDEYVGIRPSDTYKFIIMTCPVGAYYADPVAVKIENYFTRATDGGTGFAKSAGNYAGALYPTKLANQAGYQQIIWTDSHEHKYLEEAGTMNVMFIINNKLITPPAGVTVLKGVTRQSVLELAKEAGLIVEERRVTADEVISAIRNNTLKEAFGTGTAATIAPIIRIGYNGADYNLPPIETREFSKAVRKELDAIKVGLKEDTRNWIYKI